MYQCFKCGQLYEKDGKTPHEPGPGGLLYVFSMIWDCPECTKIEKFLKRLQPLDDFITIVK